MNGWMDRLWRMVRELTGDAAYERYLQTRPTQCDHPLLSRREFYAQREQNKWSGINRCC